MSRLSFAQCARHPPVLLQSPSQHQPCVSGGHEPTIEGMEVMSRRDQIPFEIRAGPSQWPCRPVVCCSGSLPERNTLYGLRGRITRHLLEFDFNLHPGKVSYISRRAQITVFTIATTLPSIANATVGPS